MNQERLKVTPLSFPWATEDPFLFCAYHRDEYPSANENMGPNVPLTGRMLGQDFTIKDGWRMYHGKKVPGFPAHPHYGFETVTVVEEGVVDHADSLGAAGRYSSGDVQWMTAGSGVQHSEMFPLLKGHEDNPLEIFQIWLNLPGKDKGVNPHFGMLWGEDIESFTYSNGASVRVIAGAFNEVKGVKPNPDSWANNPENNVGIWTIKIPAGAEIEIPRQAPDCPRNLYFYKGDALLINGATVPLNSRIQTRSIEELKVVNSSNGEAFLLVLQGKPLFEPVAQYGPFVANSQYEIQEVISKFQSSQFGGWPWPTHEQAHDAELGRFAKHSDGRLEEKGEVIFKR